MRLSRTSFSRRTLVQRAGMLAGAGLLGLGTSAPVQSQGKGKPRALALIGDRYHNPDYIRVSLDKVFKELNIPIDYTIQYDQISASLLKQYQLLLILRDGMIWPDGYLGPDAYAAYEANLETPKTFPDPKSVTWISEEQGAAIKDFVAAGNGFYALHNCSHISLSSKNYREVMGGAYISHPPLRPFQVHATANKHPITDGMSPFIVNDEQHYVTYDKDPKYIIMEAENIDGLKFEDLGTKSISGWAYDFGKGRVVFTAVGHTIHAMWNPQYLEIQKRSVRWLLKDL
ncbi:MAG: ThuA domain-containing protein [Acidobacteriaceae bacterium]|jgi:type 1 glutamine amidotransferase